MRLFRSMIEAADGLPAVGPSARMLGVRPGNAPTPAVPAVHPQDVLAPGQGGMSVAPDDPMRLTRHRRPASLGGLGQDPVWVLEADDLGPHLQFRRDSPTHGVIEPKTATIFQDYLKGLAALRARWRLYCR
jgi:hypothetical protein